MNAQDIIKLLVPVLPTIILILGGQWILNRYWVERSRKEKELDLIRTVREKQYATITNLYQLFAKL